MIEIIIRKGCVFHLLADAEFKTLTNKKIIFKKYMYFLLLSFYFYWFYSFKFTGEFTKPFPCSHCNKVIEWNQAKLFSGLI